MKSSERRFGHGSVQRPNREGRILLIARAHGIAGSVEALCLALEAMLAGYDQSMLTLPEGSQSRASVEGAFGKSPELARAILDAV